MPFTVTIVFDNQSLLPQLKTEWGFACVIETRDEKILFDTGCDGKMLLDNMASLNFSPREFSRLIISHMHWDHVGGIPEFLHACPLCTVHLPASALVDDVRIIRSLCKDVQLVQEPVQIVPNIYSSGELPGYAREQAVIIKGAGGVLILTGCAHPGVVTITNTARQLFTGLSVKLLMGGFHLNQTAPAEIINICHLLQAAGVEKIAPAHCTGDHAISLCRDIFGEKFLSTGAGFQFNFS